MSAAGSAATPIQQTAQHEAALYRHALTVIRDAPDWMPMNDLRQAAKASLETVPSSAAHMVQLTALDSRFKAAWKSAREALTHPEPDRAALVERLLGDAKFCERHSGSMTGFPLIAKDLREAAAALESIATREWIPLLDPPDEERALYDAAEYVETGGMPSPEQHMRLCKVALKLARGATP